MLGDARLSPKSKRVSDLKERIARLEVYEKWRPRAPLDFKTIVGEEYWTLHWEYHEKIVSLMRESQIHADKTKSIVEGSRVIPR